MVELQGTIKIGKTSPGKIYDRVEKGHVIKVTSGNIVSVDGMSPNILDIRPVIVSGFVCLAGNSEEDSACEVLKDDGVIKVLGVSQCVQKRLENLKYGCMIIPNNEFLIVSFNC